MPGSSRAVTPGGVLLPTAAAMLLLVVLGPSQPLLSAFPRSLCTAAGETGQGSGVPRPHRW